jgi:hypothetical protein
MITQVFLDLGSLDQGWWQGLRLACERPVTNPRRQRGRISKLPQERIQQHPQQLCSAEGAAF